MFIVFLTYKKPIDVVDQHIVAHRNYLDECYAKNELVLSGPQIPRTGGILITSNQLTRKQVDTLIQNDPFYIHEVAEYSVVEFNPVKYQELLKAFV